jgi:hypothetical protein
VLGWDWLDDDGKLIHQLFPFRAPAGAVRVTLPGCPWCGADAVLFAIDPDDPSVPWWWPAVLEEDES